jgi:hypothetical protein
MSEQGEKQVKERLCGHCDQAESAHGLESSHFFQRAPPAKPSRVAELGNIIRGRYAEAMRAPEPDAQRLYREVAAHAVELVKLQRDIAAHPRDYGYHGHQPPSDSEPVGTERSAKDKGINLEFSPEGAALSVSSADQAIWDAAWALNDPVPDGRQWKRSQALKLAIDALISAVRREGAAEQETTKALGGVSPTGVDGVPCLVPASTASHDGSGENGPK